VITSEKGLKCEKISPLLRRLENILDDRLIIMLYLMHEKFFEGESSFWKHYFAILPQRALSPLFFAEEELELILNTQLYSAIQAKKNRLMKEFQFINEAIEEWEKEDQLTFKPFGGNFTLENFFWADTMLRSRDFGIPCQDEKVYFI